MKRLTLIATSLAAATLFLDTFSSYAEKPTPGFNNKIPEQIMTPNVVKTRIGELNFHDGMPDEATVQNNV